MPIGLLNRIYFKKKVRARRPASPAAPAPAPRPAPTSGPLMTWWPKRDDLPRHVEGMCGACVGPGTRASTLPP